MNTKSLIKFGIFGLAVFVTVLTYKLYFGTPQGLKLAEKARLREYVQAPLAKKEAKQVQMFLNRLAKTAPSGASEPTICSEQRKRILSVDTNELMTEVLAGRLNMANECKTFDVFLVDRSFIDMIYANCGRQASQNQKAHDDCATGLFFYKSILVSESNMGRDIRDLSAQALAHELFAALGTSNFKTPAAIEKLKQVTDRLKDLMPESPGVYKAAVIPQMIESMEAMRAGLPTPEGLVVAIEEALTMNPGDQQVESMRLLLETREGIEVSLDKANALAAQNPESVSTQIFYARALARHKNYEESKAIIEDLASRFPNDQSVVEAQRRLAQNPQEFGTFEMSLGSDL